MNNSPVFILVLIKHHIYYTHASVYKIDWQVKGIYSAIVLFFFPHFILCVIFFLLLLLVLLILLFISKLTSTRKEAIKQKQHHHENMKTLRNCLLLYTLALFIWCGTIDVYCIFMFVHTVIWCTYTIAISIYLSRCLFIFEHITRFSPIRKSISIFYYLPSLSLPLSLYHLLLSLLVLMKLMRMKENEKKMNRKTTSQTQVSKYCAHCFSMIRLFVPLSIPLYAYIYIYMARVYVCVYYSMII